LAAFPRRRDGGRPHMYLQHVSLFPKNQYFFAPLWVGSHVHWLELAHVAKVKESPIFERIDQPF